MSLSISNLAPLRQALSEYTGSTAATAWQLGQQAESPSVAFLLGYQLALRNVDPGLQSGELAALCISERGMKSFKTMQTKVLPNPEQANLQVTGEKSHVMLMEPIQLDWMYVLALNSEAEMVCVKVATNSAGITVVPAHKPQPFLPEVPHQPVRLEQVSCDSEYVIANAHQRINKPFRYWEDVHAGLALAGWMLSQSQESNTELLVTAANQLIQIFDQQPANYTEAALAATEDLLAALDQTAAKLPESARSDWERDRQLLALGAIARQQIKAKLQSA